MKRVRHARVAEALAGALFWVFAGCLGGTAASEDRPNVVLILTDDMGWGDPKFNGGETIKTPHLDAMAAAGLRFGRFYAAAPVCSPTRGSCLTGRHPYRYGITFANVGHLKAEEETLAELLKTQGYTTGHFGKWHRQDPFRRLPVVRPDRRSSRIHRPG